MKTLTDDELVELVMEKRNEDAFQELYDRHNVTVSVRIVKLLFGYGLTREKAKEVAEDISQETWFIAWRRISSFEGRSSFITWICGIAKYNVIDWFRKNKISPMNPFSNPTVEEYSIKEPCLEPIQGKRLVLGEFAKILIRTIRTSLTSQQREVYQLKLLGWRTREIATKLGKNPSNVDVLFHKAKTKVIAVIAEQYNCYRDDIETWVREFQEIYAHYLTSVSDNGEKS